MPSIVESFALQALLAGAADYAGDEVDGKAVVFGALDLTVRLGDVGQPTENNVLGMAIIAEHEELPEPLYFQAVGYGDDLRESASVAVGQWFEVVFPVLHKLFADHETLNVETATMVATAQPSGRNHSWSIVLGPVRVIYFDDPPEAPSAGILLRTLLNEVTDVATRPLPFWIDAFVAVQESGEVLSDCRLMNEPWAIGTARLKSEAPKIVQRGKGFVSYRQFLFFQPETTRTLTEVPPLPSRPPWWKRIFRRG